MERETIIFDFDGTIADSLELAIRLYQKLGDARLPLTSERIDELRRLPALQVAKERWMLARVEVERVAFDACFGGPDVIDSPVTRDRQNPGTERAASGFEDLHPIPHAQHGFLHELFRYAGVPDDCKRDRISKAAEALVKFRHRIGLPALQASGEVLIVLRAHLQCEEESG